MVLDWFHNRVADVKIEITDEIMSRILATWTRRGIRPLFHLSEQAPGQRRGAHGDSVDSIPHALLTFHARFGVGLDIDIECRMKEQSVLKLYAKYATKTMVNNRVIWKWRHS